MRFFRSVKNVFRDMFGNSDRNDDLERTTNDSHLPSDLPFPNNDGDEYRVWIPGAENIHETEDIKMTSRGEYSEGYPEGLVVHFHSGWHLPKGLHINPFPFLNDFLSGNKKVREYAIRCARGGAKNRYNFLVMDVLGKLYQSRPLTKWGYHAGKSYWKGVGYSVSNKLAGVEMLNPSSLKLKEGKFVTWFKYVIPNQLARKRGGLFMHYSIEQERSLLNSCIWLYKNSPVVDGEKVFKIENIVGHDEASPGRKNDPGGALSVTMAEFRGMIAKEVGRQ